MNWMIAIGKGSSVIELLSLLRESPLVILILLGSIGVVLLLYAVDPDIVRAVFRRGEKVVSLWSRLLSLAVGVILVVLLVNATLLEQKNLGVPKNQEVVVVPFEKPEKIETDDFVFVPNKCTYTEIASDCEFTVSSVVEQDLRIDRSSTVLEKNNNDVLLLGEIFVDRKRLSNDYQDGSQELLLKYKRGMAREIRFQFNNNKVELVEGGKLRIIRKYGEGPADFFRIEFELPAQRSID